MSLLGMTCPTVPHDTHRVKRPIPWTSTGVRASHFRAAADYVVAMRPRTQDIAHWADRPDCAHRLPELVRRLVHSTAAPATLRQVDIPAGTEITRSGFDGRVFATSGTAFVPEGLSVWEMSCERDAAAKANRDYRAAAARIGDLDPQRITWVFVTARKWTGRVQWEAKRAAEGVWADVKAYDADSLEQWLDTSPAASAWFAEVLGMPTEALTLAAFAEVFAAQTDPPLPESIVLTGREDARRDAHRWLRGGPSVLPVAVADPAEGAAFLHAALRSLPADERVAWLDRAVVVRTPAGLRAVSQQSRDLLLVALDGDLAEARVAATRGHHVWCPSPRQTSGDRIELGRQDPAAVTATLELAGYPTEVARRLSAAANGQSGALRRLAGAPRVALASDLQRLCLTGGWEDGREADLRILAAITGLGAEEVERTVRAHSVGAEAALVIQGRAWSWRSRRDAWQASAPAVTPRDLERFAPLALEVLATADPALDLLPTDRWRASFLGTGLPFSPVLARGLAETIVLLGAHPATEAQESAASDRVTAILGQMITWQQWATLDEQLPTLAEAAPLAFLRAVERQLDRAAERRLPSLNGLMWALEILAWDASYLSASCDALAQLADASGDAGGPDHGRAVRDILLPWLPHTTAALPDRLAALERLARAPSAARFDILRSLLPGESFGTTGTRSPTWREWAAEWKEGVPPDEARQMYDAAAGHLLTIAEGDPAYWPRLLPCLRSLSGGKGRALAALGGLDAAALPPEVRQSLWEALRFELHRARSLPEAHGWMTADELAALDALYERVTPDEPLARFAWRFAATIQPPHPDPAAPDRVLADLRAEGIRAIWAALGPSGVLQLAAEQHPEIVGESVFVLGPANARAILQAASGQIDARTRGLRRGIGAAFSAEGAAAAVDALALGDLPVRERTEVLLGLRFESATWDQAIAWGAEARTAYWCSVRPFAHRVTDADMPRVLRELLDAGRPSAALEVAGGWPRERAARVPVPLLLEILRAPSDRDGMDAYYAAELLERIAAAGTLWELELREVEWIWLPHTSHDRRPATLFRALAQDPTFFTTVVERVAGADDVDSSAWSILEQWTGLPGLTAEGTIDGPQLHAWVDEARRARTTAPARALDTAIGEVLARSPPGADGYWPHEEVRAVLERIRPAGDLTQGFVVSAVSPSGARSLNPSTVGTAERSFATRHREVADALRARWPVTARCLLEISDAFTRDAQIWERCSADVVPPSSWATRDDLLRAWLVELQMAGRETFTSAEAASRLHCTEGEATAACGALADRGEVACPERGFYVIVRPEHRTAGCPPASWFIDPWMRWLGVEYRVGALTAAALHGAAHQQPQAFQVLVAEAREAVTIGRVRVQFLADPGVTSRVFASMNTETGTMQVLTPEETAFSLVAHARESGGVDAVSRVLVDLGREVGPAALATAARHHETATVQRLGYLLAAVGHRSAAKALERELATGHPSPIWLRSDAEVDAGADAPAPWRVAADRPIELDA